MNRFTWLLVLLAISAPAWSAGPKKLTVKELTDLLISLQAAKNSDEAIATELKQVQLTEELTSSVMNDLSSYLPGPLSTEQVYVLEARSSMLPPPASDLPSAPAPDPAAQQAMLAKAQEYVAKTYAQLPRLTATKMTARFQDGVETPPSYSGMHSGITNESDPVFEQTRLYVRLMNTKTDTIESENGIEKLVKDKTPWGTNGLVASVGPTLTLNTAIQEIMSNGSPKWLRWESIHGKQTAVYSFSVEKKKTHFSVLYCCFPQTDTTGTLHVQSATGPGGNSPAGPMQNDATWHNFKASTGYHGELFLDPDTGIVVRLITESDFKSSDFVHSEDIRTDFAPMNIGGKTLVVPVRSFNVAEVVPNGDANAAHFMVRHQMVTEDYKDYQIAGAATAQK